MGCGKCGQGSSLDNLFIYIDGKEFKQTTRMLSVFLRSISSSFKEDTEYKFKQINKKTNSMLTGRLVFKSGFPYLNGRRVF